MSTCGCHARASKSASFVRPPKDSVAMRSPAEMPSVSMSRAQYASSHVGRNPRWNRIAFPTLPQAAKLRSGPT